MGLLEFSGSTPIRSDHWRSRSREILLGLWINLAGIFLWHHVCTTIHGTSYHNLWIRHRSLHRHLRHVSGLVLEGHIVLVHGHHLLVGMDHLRLHHLMLHHLGLHHHLRLHHHLWLHHLRDKHGLLTIERVRFGDILDRNLYCYFNSW